MKIIRTLIAVIAALALMAWLAFNLIMQTSYRLCPSSDAEIAENPALMKYVEVK